MSFLLCAATALFYFSCLLLHYSSVPPVTSQTVKTDWCVWSRLRWDASVQMRWWFGEICNDQTTKEPSSFHLDGLKICLNKALSSGVNKHYLCYWKHCGSKTEYLRQWISRRLSKFHGANDACKKASFSCHVRRFVILPAPISRKSIKM